MFLGPTLGTVVEVLVMDTAGVNKAWVSIPAPLLFRSVSMERTLPLLCALVFHREVGR